MNLTEAEEVVRWVIRTDIGDEEAAKPLTAFLREDLNFDELDYVETAILLEKKLALPVTEGGAFQLVEIPDEDMADWKTVQDVVNTVVKVTS